MGDRGEDTLPMTTDKVQTRVAAFRTEPILWQTLYSVSHRGACEVVILLKCTLAG